MTDTRFFFLVLALILMPAPASAKVIAEGAWLRLPPPVADIAAAYMILRNDGDQDVVVVRVSSDASKTAEIHGMQMQGSVMHMQMLKNLTIPARGFVKLEPGGMHVMLVGLKRPLSQGQTVHVSLRFKTGGVLNIEAGVRDMRASREDDQQIYKQAMNLAGKNDFVEAAKLFRQVARRGGRRAQYQLGLLYARGSGVKKDFSKARDWLRKAAMQGHPKAQFYLGQMYAFGDGGEQDNVKATMWFWLATTLGDRFARDSLRVMTGKISALELSEAKKQARALWREMPHDMKIKRGTAMH